MPGNVYVGNDITYLKIVDGKLSHKVPEGTHGAKFRKWEVGGKKGDLWEILYKDWTGVIQDITIRPSNFVKNQKECVINLGDAVITLHVGGKHFEDFVCKVFNADRDKPIYFKPFRFQPEDREKPIIGLTLKQDMDYSEVIDGITVYGRKLKNYFYDYEKEENLHGFPKIDDKEKDKDGYWTIHFVEVTNFLLEQLGKLQGLWASKAPRTADDVKGAMQSKDDATAKAKEVMEEEMTIEDLPF